MDKSAIEHISESVFSHPISNNEVEIRLKTRLGDDIEKIELIYNDKFKFHNKTKSLKIIKSISDEYFTYFVVRLKLLKDKRLAYIFKITLLNGKVYYFSESGVTEEYEIENGHYDFFQVPFINDSDVIKIHKKFQNRVVYQIFIDRFYKSEDNKNPRINIKWGDDVTSTTLAGGNLKGITEKLDYLVDLGIDALYLTPICEGRTNHKYDTVDYFRVAEDFGTSIDLQKLINECHKRGIIVILDGVFNHISIENDIFKDVIKNGYKSKYYKWFFIHGKHVNLITKNYETFAYTRIMPRLNLNNVEVQDYIISVAKHYIKNFGIDGYRLDVSDEIPHSFWARFNIELRQLNKDVIILGENWHNAQSFLNSGFEFHSIMNYSITKNLLNFVAWEKYSPTKFKNSIISDLMRYKTNVNYNLMNLISSHDVARFLTLCNEDEDKLLVAYAFIFIHLGIPCIYYGDEIGMNGGGDPKCRKCFEWDSSKWNTKILKIIKQLIFYHKELKFNERDYEIEVLNDLIYIKRSNSTDSITLIINMTTSEKEIIQDGEILVSNNYQQNKLYYKGFLLIKN